MYKGRTRGNLPNVGGNTGNDHQRSRLRRRQNDAKYSHYDGWQANADDPFDEACEQKRTTYYRNDQ